MSEAASLVAFTHDTYLSPFTWRYGSREMREVWSEAHRRRLWRRIWVALADAEQAGGTGDRRAGGRSAQPRGRDRPGRARWRSRRRSTTI